jgi:glutaredoxin
MKVICVLTILIAAATTAAQSNVLNKNAETSAQSASTEGERCLRFQVFIRGDSQLCADAVSYAESLVERRGGICIEVVDIQNDKAALAQYWQLMQRFDVKKPVVPAFHACNLVKVGFSSEAKSKTEVDELFAIHAYVRQTCQHCRDAKRFLNGLAARWKGIRVTLHDVDAERGAMPAMTELAKRHGITSPALPVISVCGRLISGYRTDATTGRQIEGLLLDASVAALPDKPAARLAGILGPPVLLIESYEESSFSDGDPSPLASGANHAIQTGSQDIEMPVPDSGEDQRPAEKTYSLPVEAPEGVELPWLGYVRVRDLGLFTFTLLIGLVDGFNPCAMWLLVFLLSVLVNVKDRRKIAAIAGTFVLVSGLAYFTFMAAWLNLFLLVGMARPLQIALGVLAIVIGVINVKDFFAFKRGVTLSIPESARPGIYERVRKIATTKYVSAAIGLAVVLAVLVNIVEILCTAGLPALYTQILAAQQLPAWINYAFLGLYNVAYMFDDSLMVGLFVVTLSHRKMREMEGRWLKLVSGLVVLGLGLVILFKPNWLQW